MIYSQYNHITAPQMDTKTHYLTEDRNGDEHKHVQIVHYS